MRIPCPNCGSRPYTEFSYGGEVRPVAAADPDADFARVYLLANAAGPQREWWFHAAGCRRWLRVVRDTATNRIDGLD
jgi:sarcosine oxidase subunit delta